MEKLLQNMLNFRNDDVNYYLVEADWNFVENINLDKKGGNPKIWGKSCTIMSELVETFDLIDIWRTREENRNQYTWWNAVRGLYSRIDRFYISDCLQSSVNRADIIPSVKSDHQGVFLNLEQIKTSKGRGLWRFNITLLRDGGVC